MPTWPPPRSERLGTPDPPAIRFARGTYFGASWFTHLLQPVRLLAPLYGSDRNAQPPGAFTSRLSTDRSPSPLLGMTTTATGLLCWRDLHPLEWQLASLHQIRTCSFPAYGSHLGYQRRLYAAVCEPAPLTRLPGSAPARALLARIPLGLRPSLHRLRRGCIRCGLLRSGTRHFVLRLHSYYGRARASSATTPRLPDADQVGILPVVRHESSQVPTRSLCA